MNDIAVCTISARNFSAHAITLLNSIRQFHSDVDFFYVVADEEPFGIQREKSFFEVVRASDLGIASFNEMSFKYDIVELNVALKPFVIKKLIDKGYKKVLYFDADIMVFSSLDVIINLLESYSIIVTPHILSPITLKNKLNILENGLLKNGCYNLGFIGVSNTNESNRFLQWWADKCSRDCYREPESGLFVDQKWIDLVPSIFNYVYILKNAGCNMAYWNLHERKLQKNMMMNNKERLIFFHFSGLEIENINQISKYQSTYLLSERQDLQDIFQSYRANVITNGYEKVKNLEYAYNQYSNGLKIGLVARRLYSSVSQQYPDPFSTKKNSYYMLLKKHNLLEYSKESFITEELINSKCKSVNSLLRIICRIMGVNHYSNLMRYMRYVSIIRQQSFLLGKDLIYEKRDCLK